MASLLTRIFGSRNQRLVKKLQGLAVQVGALESRYQTMSDADLAAQTGLFRERLARGETLDGLMPEAFAVVREAGRRVLGMRHFDVQLIGGAVLHQGKISEMRTGEGKTLVSTLPAYLNALSGKGVHIVTVNDYLARRDAEWMGRIHQFLGLSVGVIMQGMQQISRKRPDDPVSFLADFLLRNNPRKRKADDAGVGGDAKADDANKAEAPKTEAAAAATPAE